MMPTLSDFLQNTNVYGWMFIPGAILLGALHGLEPGHSKTMMASFIVAIRGSVSQAVLLGVAATISHTSVVWIISLAGIYFGYNLDSGSSEPYFQLASAALVIGIALRMFWRTRHSLKGHFHHHEEVTSQGHTHPTPGFKGVEDISGFTNTNITTGQLLVFGLTGGLVPCSAAITVLILCLQLKQIVMGALLVLSFSVGLAMTLIASGVLAAVSVRYTIRKWPAMDELAGKLPYFSGGIILIAGVCIGYDGLRALMP